MQPLPACVAPATRAPNAGGSAVELGAAVVEVAGAGGVGRAVVARQAVGVLLHVGQGGVTNSAWPSKGGTADCPATLRICMAGTSA